MGPSGAKQVQMVPNSAKWCKTGSNGAKKGQKGPTEPNGAQKGKWGQTRPKRVLRGKRGQMGSNVAVFCMHAYFYEIKRSCLATQALRQKLAELWGFC